MVPRLKLQNPVKLKMMMTVMIFLNQTKKQMLKEKNFIKKELLLINKRKKKNLVLLQNLVSFSM